MEGWLPWVPAQEHPYENVTSECLVTGKMSTSHQPDTSKGRASTGANPGPGDLTDEELAALVQSSPYLDPHSKRYWLAIIAHLHPEHRQALAAALLGSDKD